MFVVAGFEEFKPAFHKNLAMMLSTRYPLAADTARAHIALWLVAS